MKKTFATILAIALTYSGNSSAINPEDCEIDGEIVFTQECLNEMLKKKEAESNANKEKSSDMAIEPKKITETSLEAAIPTPTPDEKASETIQQPKKTLSSVEKNCNKRDFFKALEGKNQQYLRQCKLTPSLLNSVDTRAEKRGRTPLHWAVLTKNYTLLIELLSKEINTNTRSQADLRATPLHLSVIYEDIKSINELLKKVKNIDAQNLLKETPLHLAVKTGNQSIIKLLLDAGANIEARDRTGKTPLLTASLSSNVSTIQYLLAHGANANVQTRQGNNPLHYSVLISPVTTEALLLAGVDLDQKNLSMQTPTEKLQANYLPQHKTTVQIVESFKRAPSEHTLNKNPLLVSLENGDLKLFKEQLKQGTSPATLTLGDLHNKPDFIKELQQKGWIE